MTAQRETTTDGTAPASAQLRRSVGMRHMVVFGLSFMVPIAPFGVFGAIYAASQGQVVAAYVIGTVVMAVTAASFTTMAREFGGVGSVHTFVSRGVGPAVAALTLAVALTAAQADGGLTTLVSLVNVGALTALAALHVAAFVHFVVRGGSRRGHHLLIPLVGVLAIGVVVASSADVARTLGAVWLGLGITVLAVAALVTRRRSRTRAAP